MSSILDALKKVEDEKKARQAAERATGDSFQPEVAAAELLGETHAEGALAIQLSRKALIAGVVVLVAVVLSGTVLVMSVLRSPEAPTSASASPSGNGVAIPLSSTAIRDPNPTIVVTSTSSDSVVAVEESTTVPPVQRPALLEQGRTLENPTRALPVTENATVQTPSDAKEPLAERDTKPIQVATVVSVPTTFDVVPAPTPASLVPKVSTAPPPRARPVIPEDIRNLPALRSSERARFGLEGLKINMLRAPSANRPRGSVVINLKKVYLDEFIPGTTARLVSIATHGIAIQVGSEPDLYFVAN